MMAIEHLVKGGEEIVPLCDVLYRPLNGDLYRVYKNKFGHVGLHSASQLDRLIEKSETTVMVDKKELLAVKDSADLLAQLSKEIRPISSSK
jgi:hypothetical protein